MESVSQLPHCLLELHTSMRRTCDLMRSLREVLLEQTKYASKLACEVRLH